MLRSLYSGISGLKTHQIRMDTIGNNIANVNTTGYKRSRVDFSTLLSQTINAGSSPDPSVPPKLGGTNPIQIGIGTQVGAIAQIMTQGSTQSTGKETDMLIQGKGFFVLNNGGVPAYTRAGTFSLDSGGNLIDPGTGAPVQGYNFQTSPIPPAAPEAPAWPVAGVNPANYGNINLATGSAHPSNADTELQSFNIDQSGTITGVYKNTITGLTENHKVAQIAIASFNNDAGLMSIGTNFFVPSNNSGTVNVGAAGQNGRGTIVPNSIEMSNVDLSQEFTDMIVTQRGFQANSRVITVTDTLLQELIDLKRN